MNEETDGGESLDLMSTRQGSNIRCGQGAVASWDVLLKVLEEPVHRLNSEEHRRARAARWGGQNK